MLQTSETYIPVNPQVFVNVVRRKKNAKSGAYCTRVAICSCSFNPDTEVNHDTSVVDDFGIRVKHAYFSIIWT